ncbi:hypothetical protein STEG23_029378 [Scotinomys teguina]
MDVEEENAEGEKDGQEHHRHQKFHPGTTVTVALFSPNAQCSLRTEGIEGMGGCINNSIALCQRTRLEPRVRGCPDPSLLPTSEVSCFTQIPLFPVRFIRLTPLLTTVLDSHLSSRSPYGPPTAPRHDPDQQE